MNVKYCQMRSQKEYLDLDHRSNAKTLVIHFRSGFCSFDGYPQHFPYSTWYFLILWHQGKWSTPMAHLELGLDKLMFGFLAQFLLKAYVPIVYIYIYTHIHIYIYLYIHIYIYICISMGFGKRQL